MPSDPRSANRITSLAMLMIGIIALTYVSFLFQYSSFTLAQNKKQVAKLELRPGDHISIIGNTLADRMQHDGWLETYLYRRFPKHKLVFRNLGFSGDELTLRLRSRNFGSPDEWLIRTQADVVFAFFGYNESFQGKAGLPKFKSDLENFIKRTLSQKYNGNSAPRLVLFSPIGHEDLNDPNLPDGSENNARLAMYTKAMQEVAARHPVVFVDLFHPTQKLYAKSKEPLTINGVHLNEHGNKLVGKLIDELLFGKHPPRDNAHLERIRFAVKEKNFYWFNRYRTVDGYSIYGGRAGLKFVNGQTNREVMQREMKILDEMTANRDPLCWAAAQGKDYTVDDSNTSAFIPVISNKPGKLPGGKHLFLDGEEAITKMKLGKGMKVELFASEEDFPELINPVQMAFDTKGRLWVAAWPTYPHWKPKTEMNDKLLIFEDTDGDGQADKMKTFAGDLHCPTGFEFYNGGVLVAQAPDLVFLKDTNGDDVYDVKVRVLNGLDSADTHHTANSFTFDPGGALYFQEGTFHHTQVETAWGPPVRCANAGVFRYEPRAQKFEVYVNFGFANPHGHVFDKWGQDVVIDGTGAVPYHGTLFSGQTDFPQRHSKPPVVYNRKTRPCPGLEIMSSRHFPEEMQGNLLVPNVIGFLGIMQYKLKDDGASFQGVEMEPLLSSSDPNFRPADLEIGPDGALYFTDWQNPIIGHMQHNLRDPNRDQKHGRIYKLTYTKNPLLKPAKIDGASIDDLLNLLKEPENRTRYRARIELGERDTKEVIAAVKNWITTLDKEHPDYEHHLMEALWMHQYHNVVNQALLKRMLQSRDFNARAAATRVLCYWRDRVTDPLKLLKTQINDRHPRVRLEAIRALSFFHDEEAWLIAIELLAHPDDRYLRYTFGETLNTLERRLGSKLNRKNIAASLIKMLGNKNIEPARLPVLIETICRHGGGKELAVIWDQARQKNKYNPKLRRQVLQWLADAAVTRRVKPKVNPAEVQQLLQDNVNDEKLLPAAIELATGWNVNQAAGALKSVALSDSVKTSARLAAIDGLAAFSQAGKTTLEKLVAPPYPIKIRLQAAVALSKIDLPAGAAAAAKALAVATDPEDIDPAIAKFLTRKEGSKQLAAALEKEQVSADTAKQILRAMYLAGRNDPSLQSVVSKLAGLGAPPEPPSEAEVKKLMELVKTQGDPAKGELVFRRADLGCLKCHAINKAGGDIGPDLGPIGGSSPVDYIIRSILDPSQSIKEEYLTKVVTTSSGLFYTGIEVERNKNEVVLKDATGKLIRVPAADIDAEGKGKSLMPEGVTQILTKNELIDLISFVSALGKPGPFKAPKMPTIQAWKYLRNIPDPLLQDIPNRDQLRDLILRADPDAWESVFTYVNGSLPLSALKKPGAPKVAYLQGVIQVVQGGNVEINIKSPPGTVFWVDEEPFAQQAKSTVKLAPGRRTITVRLELDKAKPSELMVELRKPRDSRAHFEVVSSE